jgi:hypothetical protein
MINILGLPDVIFAGPSAFQDIDIITHKVTSTHLKTIKLVKNELYKMSNRLRPD